MVEENIEVVWLQEDPVQGSVVPIAYVTQVRAAEREEAPLGLYSAVLSRDCCGCQAAVLCGKAS